MLADCVDDVGQRLFYLVEGCDEAFFYGGFEVAPGALEGRRGHRCLLCDVGEAEVHEGLVEFLGRDLALAHRVAEITGERAVVFEGFLDLARRAGDGCGDLIPVLGR